MLRSRVFFDGTIRWEDEALVSPLSTGVLYGDGVFEILRSYDGVPFRFTDHYERLAVSCKALRLQLIYDEENLWLIIRELLRQNELTERDGYVRITVFGADLNLISSEKGITTHTFAHARRFTPPRPAKYKRGIKARVSSFRASPYSPIATHNTTCYLPMILARRAAWERGIDEVFVQSTEGGVIEGSTSSLLIVKKGKIITPSAKEGIQLRVARKVVLEVADQLGIEVREGSISLKNLMDADEVLISNSLIEVMPVREIDGTVMGTGSAGPVAIDLLKGYRETVKKECS